MQYAAESLTSCTSIHEHRRCTLFLPQRGALHERLTLCETQKLKQTVLTKIRGSSAWHASNNNRTCSASSLESIFLKVLLFPQAQLLMPFCYLNS